MQLHMNLVMLAVVTLAVGYFMTVAGLQKSALEWKRRRRICPSCGHEIQARVCATCTH